MFMVVVNHLVDLSKVSLLKGIKDAFGFGNSSRVVARLIGDSSTGSGRRTAIYACDKPRCLGPGLLSLVMPGTPASIGGF